MAIEKMKEVNLISDADHIQSVLLRFQSLDYFHPELAQRIVESVSGLKTLNQSNPYSDTLSKLHEICECCQIYVNDKTEVLPRVDLEKLNNEIDELQKEFRLMSETREEILKIIDEDKVAYEQLLKIKNLNINFDELFQCEYVKLRIGKMPKENVNELDRYDTKPYLWIELGAHGKSSLVFYMTTLKYEGEVDNLFTSLGFERIRIPGFVHGKPSEAIVTLSEEIESNMAMLDHVNQKIEDFKSSQMNRLSKYEKTLLSLSSTYELQKYVVVFGQRASISGFIPQSKEKDLLEAFKDIPSVDIEINEAYSDSRLTPPTKLKNNWFVRPFEMFVEMYGMPAYDEIDPTPFMAITYCLLFGIMFADLGQGLVVSLVGWFVYKKKNLKLGAIMERIGIFAAGFGLIFGSVFGNEHLLDPMFHALGFEEKPFEVLDASFTMKLLIGAVAIGAVLILCSMLLNMYIKLKKKEYGPLLFSQNGIAGFVLYGGLVGGIGATMLMGVNVFNPLFIAFVIILPVLVIFMQEPLERLLEHEKMFPEGIGGFLMTNVFELIEIALTFLSNTMSYMRVGGFVLSHAGMMLVVSVLMDITGNASPIVFVFGNIFVMVLEGMIVGIQVLRLEFYEMFSRYFSGTGIAFKSIN